MHFVMIRSSYSKAEPHRLEVTRRITVPSLRSQSLKDFELIVRLDRRDPLISERMEVFESAGVPVNYVYYEQPTADRSDRSLLSSGWRNFDRSEPDDLQTRMDDDDALAKFFVRRIRDVDSGAQCVYSFINGVVAQDGRITHRKYPGNQFLTYRGQGSVYDMTHNELADQNRLVKITDAPAWMWVRHGDAITVRAGKVYAHTGANLKNTSAFDVDWNFLKGLN
jgi:hypothetical protein